MDSDTTQEELNAYYKALGVQDRVCITRDGRKAHILTTQGPNKEFPIIGCVEGEKNGRDWSLRGRYFEGPNLSDLDLMDLDHADG